jgi:choline dehydrogenase-like flavoprotein
VKLHETERDQYGLPVAHVIFSHHENDKRMVAHAKVKMKEILEAAAGKDLWTADRTAHLLGTCRMGGDPSNSVVNADCRSHDIPNLFICDGSVFPTSTGVNPSLTIQAIAARTAARICGESGNPSGGGIRQQNNSETKYDGIRSEYKNG